MLLFSECVSELVGKRFEKVIERAAFRCLQEGLDRHARSQHQRTQFRFLSVGKTKPNRVERGRIPTGLVQIGRNANDLTIDLRGQP